MIRSIGISLVVTVLTVGVLPSNAQAQTSPDERNQRQIARFFTKLKNLPRGGAGPAKVIGFTRRLVKLDAPRAQRYFKVAVLRFPVVLAVRKTARLEAIVIRLVNSSRQLTPQQARRTARIVSRIANRVEPPAPTPTPYQARSSARNRILIG